MPKIKTNRAAAKRFKATGTGKLKRNKAYRRHILTKKTTKNKRNLRKAAMMDQTNIKNMKCDLDFIAFCEELLCSVHLGVQIIGVNVW